MSSLMAESKAQSNQITDVINKIELARQARQHKFYLRDDHITLSHGSGGKATHNLVEGIFAPAFANPVLEPMDDAATFAPDLLSPRLAFTTDSYVVHPLFFPGGEIGKLAVHGTINDLAMAGAEPLYLSAGFILEEGFPIADLRRIVASMAEAAAAAGVARDGAGRRRPRHPGAGHERLARVLRLVSQRAAAGQPDPSPARLLRRSHVPAHRQRRNLPYEADG